ncbi:polysaccharide biosynthesis protein [Actinomycetes bacterium M1A6_2h]
MRGASGKAGGRSGAGGKAGGQSGAGGKAAIGGLAFVTAGSMVANIASYLLHLPASRWLGPLGYGEFATLLAAQLVLAVPALALQTVIARDTVRGRSGSELRALAVRCAVVVAVSALALVPILAYVLDIAVSTTAAALLTAPVLVLLAAEQGLLQGNSRFGALSAVLAGGGVAKVAPALIVLAFGGSTGSALLASAVGTLAMAAIARAVTGPSTPGPPSSSSWTSVLAASQVQLVVIGLSSIDLVLARVVLTKEDAGLYALGAVATKAAFWLPQAVGVVFFPAMSDPARSTAAVRTVLLVLVAVGTTLVVGVVAVSPFASFVVGDAYTPVQGLLWVFALQGAALAVVQGALLSSVARDRTGLTAAAWVGLAIEVVVVTTWGTSVARVVTVAASCAVCTAVVVWSQLYVAERSAQSARS